MNKEFVMIVPMINTSLDTADIVPIEFQYDNRNGQMNCINVINDINTDLITQVVFVILKKHNIKYNIKQKINIGYSLSKFKDVPHYIHVLDDPTRSQAETIYKTIKDLNLDSASSLFIKDADNSCVIDDLTPDNAILTYKLEDCNIIDPQHKSYIELDDQNFITNTIEKKVISGYFNCGGYVFEQIKDFVQAYDMVNGYEEEGTHMYISHIIYFLLVHKGAKFRPVFCKKYNDFVLKNIMHK